MKNLSECKEYYKDLYMDCLENDSFEKSIFESTEKARYETFCETLKFIYGEDFKTLCRTGQMMHRKNFIQENSQNRHFWRSVGTAPPALMRQGTR